jgi:hypothetical protein
MAIAIRLARRGHRGDLCWFSLIWKNRRVELATEG